MAFLRFAGNTRSGTFLSLSLSAMLMEYGKKAHLSITHANQLIRCRQPVWFFFPADDETLRCQRRISLPTGGYRMKRPGNTISDISRPLILAHRKIILVRNRSPRLHEANTAIFHLISLRLMSREEATTQSHRIFLVRAMWANQLGSRSPSRQQWPIQLQAADKGKQWQVGQVSRAPPDSVFGNWPEWGRILTLHRLPFNGKLTNNQVPPDPVAVGRASQTERGVWQVDHVTRRPSASEALGDWWPANHGRSIYLRILGP